MLRIYVFMLFCMRNVIKRMSSYWLSLYKVSLVVCLSLGCLCSYWNNFVWFTQPLSQCDVLWSERKVCTANGQWFFSWNDGTSSHYNDGLWLTVRGAQSQRTLREVCPTKANQTHWQNELETWAEHRGLFLFLGIGGIGGFGKLRHSRSRTTRAGEMGLSSPPADTRVRWGSGQKIIAQPMQLHSRPINFSIIVDIYLSGKKGKIWLKDDRFCKHLSDCVYKW